MVFTNQNGFVKSLVIICIGVAILFFLKDEKGVSYLETSYKKVHYYLVERNTKAIEKATDTKNIMQSHQNNLQKMVDEN